ncbi:MAG TPA: outer membrane protein transport protein [Candidatus Acidoferrales bacterium]|nr:outer membrane protein transport protein [Candidatus Acidoferrales bacterium]
MANLSVLVLAFSFGTARPVFSGGFAIPPQSAKAAALANAVTAGVKDPSAVYSNPAALTEIEGNQLLGGINYINTVSSVTNSGSKSRNRHDDDFIPTAFANYHLPGTNLTLGIGVYTPFGLATTYDRNGFTRFAAVQSELKDFFVTPSIAWSPTPYLSLGAGISFVHSSAVFSRSLFLLLGEGRLRITDTDNTYAYDFGVLLKPLESVKLGLTYRGRVDLDFDSANVKFSDVGGTGSRARAKGIHVPLPPVISAGVNWQINPSWEVEFVYDFTRWSEFDHLRAKFSPALPALGGGFPISKLFIPQDWKDTSTLRFGTVYRVLPYLELRGGIALDETPIPARTLGPAIPGADWLTVTGGIGYSWKSFSFDLGYMAVFYKTRKVLNNVLEGSNVLVNGSPAPGAPGVSGPDKYETFQNLVLFNLTYRF